ncbi:Biotin carboxyl carrier protein of acetyl-CoA carboxylase [Alphaproteobacteria bacterium SO-S41]|nr:Biotin carboxyl carrier protein of acetyl-CoA carboxylase [Alphaproteobacteria bacterium SO-S41]
MTTPKKTSIVLPPRMKLPVKTSDAGSAEGDIAFVTTLAHLLEQANVTEIEVERAGLKVRVSRASAAAPQVVYAPAPSAAPAAAAPVAAAPAAKPAAPAETDWAKHPGAVTSPMVGTAYLSPKPGDPAFVQVGDTVKEDQTLLIVEAMKTMNPIPSPKAGRITQIFVVDARPVEYGEVLMIIE